jgi:NTE family protein
MTLLKKLKKTSRNYSVSKKKVGLALGGGAARGLAHIGVLEVLEKEGIPIDMIAGTSMGAIIGGYYAAKKDIKSMRPLAIAFGARRLRYFSDFTFPHINAVGPLAKAFGLENKSHLSDFAQPWTGIIKGHRIEQELKKMIGAETEFHDLHIPFSCVAVDIDNGEEVVIRDGKVWEAVRASSSIPVFFNVVKIHGRNLVDGGLMNPVPTKTVRNMGADFVITINVLPYKATSDLREPGIFSIMMKAFYILDAKFIETSIKDSDAVIEPDVVHIAFTDFQRAEECIEKGAAAARKIVPEIKRKLSLA